MKENEIKEGNAIRLKPGHIILIAVITLVIVIGLFNLNTITRNRFEICTTKFNDFGTFYGGMLGTLIAFFGIYFIYKTFENQEKQLDIIKKEADLRIVYQLYDNILQEINSIQFRKRSDKN